MYRLKVNKLKAKFVTSKQRIVFGRYEIMVGPGDVVVYFADNLYCVCSKEAFSEAVELVRKEKKFIKKGKK